MSLSDSSETSYDVFVSAVANPHAFWIHLINDEAKQLDYLIDAMSEFYNDRKCDAVSSLLSSTILI
jgi:hypothetical protein